MSTTLLQLTDTICGELGITQPATVIGSTDLQTVQLYNLVNRSGKAHLNLCDWTFLQGLKVITSTAALVTTGNTTISSAVITNIPTTAVISANTWVVTGSNIPVAARVVTVDSGTQVTMDSLATSTATAVALTFSQDTYALPTDFNNYINGTAWDRTNRWPIIGPDSPQIDEWHRSGIVTTGPRRHFRQIGAGVNSFRLWPPPGGTEAKWESVFEYIQNTWCQSAAGTGKSSMTVDTDITLIDPDAIILDVIWRFLRAKQFQYADQMQEWKEYLASKMAQDGGAKTLTMAGHRSSLLLTPAQIPDGFWPSS